MTGTETRSVDEPVLRVRGLSLRSRERPIVSGVDLELFPGECVAIVGESGAGKSLTSRALLGLLPDGVRAMAEELRVDGVDARRLGERAWRRLRGSRIALVAQDALVSLDPLRRIGAEVAEPLEIHAPRLRRTERRQRVSGLLRRVAMPDPERRARQYPHELSGGLRQRALIASALAAAPAVLVADEPTTALDATVQARVLGLLREIVDAGTGLLLVSHDLSAVRRVADRVIVMRDGVVVETGTTEEVLDRPRDAYTRTLRDAVVVLPGRDPRAASEAASRSAGDRAEAPEGHVVADAGQPRAAEVASRSAADDDRSGPLLVVRDLSRAFDGIPAVQAAGFAVPRRRTLGIVGESGSGKTTLARLMIGVDRPDAGALVWAGGIRPRIQFVHQNPLGAFDPRWSIGRSLREALEAGGVPAPERAGRTEDLLREVDLDPALARRRPVQLSGGQRQRAALARALAADPELLVLDEPVSALDPTVRARVLSLLGAVQRERGLTMVLISHDLAVVGAVCDEVVVMQRGRIVEQGPVAEVFTAPQHPFTRELLEASA